MKQFRTPLLFAISLLFVACSGEKPATPDQQAPDATGQPEQPNESTLQPKVMGKPVVHDVKCGCSIDGIGHCGNYILIDGKYVPLLHPTLGKMEFCKFKDKGAKIETVGAVKDGKFVAESWKLVE